MDRERIVYRIREEFREMPGLRHTPAQATRLRGLEHDPCRAVIDSSGKSHTCRSRTFSK